MITYTMLKQACWFHTQFYITRYLMSNTAGHANGAEKAQRHSELCTFYVAVARFCDLDEVRRKHEADYKAVHSLTQTLTDNLDEEICFPLEGVPDYDALETVFHDRFFSLAMQALNIEPGPWT